SAAQACGLSRDEFVHAFWLRRLKYDAGLFTPVEYWRDVAAIAGRTFDDALIAEMIKREVDFWTNYDHRVIAWVDQLRDAGYSVGMLSNLPQPLAEHMKAERTLLDRFDHLTLSYELKTAKPDAPIYEHAIRGLAIAPGDGLFIDDKP